MWYGAVRSLWGYLGQRTSDITSAFHACLKCQIILLCETKTPKITLICKVNKYSRPVCELEERHIRVCIESDGESCVCFYEGSD